MRKPSTPCAAETQDRLPQPHFHLCSDLQLAEHAQNPSPLCLPGRRQTAYASRGSSQATKTRTLKLLPQKLSTCETSGLVSWNSSPFQIEGVPATNGTSYSAQITGVSDWSPYRIWPRFLRRRSRRFACCDCQPISGEAALEWSVANRPRNWNRLCEFPAMVSDRGGDKRCKKPGV